MLTIILLLLILFIPSLYFSIKKDIDIECLVPCTIFSIILIIYIFGFFDLLKLGVYTIYILAVFFLIFLIKEILNNKTNGKRLLKIIWKPSMCIWFIGLIIAYFYFKGRMLTNWDEFSHWGDVVKMMYHNNIYNTNPMSLSFARGYPPVMSIFQYFVENLSFNGYQEHYLFSSYHIFVISLIIPFVKKIKWRDIFKIILILIVLILAPTIFFSSPYYYYSIIYIDPFLGILFGYVMANIYITKHYNKFIIINISLSLFALTLTKDIAPVFSFISLAFVFLNIVFADKKYKTLRKIRVKNLKNFFRQTKPIWIFLGVILLSYASWRVNVIINVRGVTSTNHSTLKDVINTFLGQDHTYRTIVVSNYINTLSTFKVCNMGNIYIFTSIIILFSILLYNNENDDNKLKSVFGFSTMIIGEIVYIILMLVLYLLMFAEYEATSLASFDRYIGIYLTAVLFFVIFITIHRCVEKKSYKNLLILMIIVLLNINIPGVLYNFFENKTNKNNTVAMRQPYISASKSIRKKIHKKGKYKFYIIVQNSQGIEKWILRYEIRDILKEMNEGFNWSLGEKYSNGDIWTLDISKNEFKKILLNENYEYVYLFKIDEPFIKKYGNIFNSSILESGQLYKVNREKARLELIN